MSIKQNGGVFGRNPTFNDVTIEGQLTFDGDIDVNSDLKVDGNLDVTGNLTLPDNSKAIFGTGSGDLEIFHDGGNSYIKDVGTNDLRIWADNPNIASLSGNKYFYGNSGVAELFYNGSKRFYTTSGGSTIVGNLGFASGDGIDFSATAGTGTSELFDDYEEGQWQPVYTSTTDAADNVNNSRVGYYTKVGNIVYATAYLIGNDLSGITSTDPVRIDGLPFASSSTVSGNDQAVTVGQYRYLLTTDHTLLVPNASSYVGVTTDGFSGATYATFFQYPNSTGTSLKISMVYQAQ